MKKVLALLLVLVLAIGMFAACGTDSGNNEETKDTANNATTEGGNDETKPSEENGNNTEGKTLKVGMICIGDENDQGYTYNFYRAKDSVTEKMAAKAIKYKRSMALEPMNSYERHVIHTALQDYEGVTTSSTGTEPNRRVVVSYEKPQRPSNKPVSREWS